MTDEHRFEFRIATPGKLSNTDLERLVGAGEGDGGWDVVARDPIGVALVVHVATDDPAVELQRRWASAVAWWQEHGSAGSVVAASVVPEEVHEAEAFEPDTPELLGATEVAEILGVSRQRVHQLASAHAHFPAPYARLGAGPIWTRTAIEAFDRRWERRPGRPAHRAS